MFTSGMIYEITPSLNTEAAINNYSWTSFPFDGLIKARPLNDLSELFKKDLEDCFEILFSGNWRLNGSGGSGGSGGGTEGPSGGTTNWGPTRISTGNFRLTYPTNGGNSGNGGGSTPCVTVTNMVEVSAPVYNNVTRTNYVAVMGYDCNGDGKIDEKSIINGKAGQKNKDCNELLEILGLLLRPLSTPNPSTLTYEQISEATSKTNFNETAVMDMIDPDAFEACYDSGTQGSICVTNQVIDYLNGLDIEPIQVPGTSLTITTNFDNTPHEALSVFLNAAVAAHGNEFVLQAIGFANRKLNSIPSEISLDEAILYFAKLDHNGDGELSEEKMIAFLHIANTVISTGISDSRVWNRLAENPDHTTALGKVLSDYNNDEPSIATAQHYALEAIDGIDAFDGDLETRIQFFEAHIDFFDEIFTADAEDSNPILYINLVSDKIATLYNSNPEFYEENRALLYAKALYQVFSEQVHIGLDLAGMFPALGIGPDALNTVFYTVEGEWKEAVMSSSSMIPIAGQFSTIAKYSAAFNNLSRKAVTVTWDFTSRADGLVDFGTKSSYKKHWGFAGGAEVHGHHIIPKDVRFADHPLIQKAARSQAADPAKHPFHMHDLNNGIPLNEVNHLTGHNSTGGYSDRVHDALEEAAGRVDLDDIPAEDVAKAIRNWQSIIRSRLEDMVQANGNVGDVQIPPIIFN